jgi:hypothetical protein
VTSESSVVDRARRVPAAAVVETELGELLDALRRCRWVQYRWGPQNQPELVAWVFVHAASADVILLRGEGEDATQSVNGATGYRKPLLPADGPWDPEVVVYQYHSTAVRTLRAMLALPAPDAPGAPTHVQPPTPDCALPADLPSPTVIRPLGVTS